MIIRPVATRDLSALHQIAVESGPGFTSLVDDPDFLMAKIRHSMMSFSRTVNKPGDESYLFVLEDPETGEVMGTTGIEATVGVRRPLHHFQRSNVVHHSPELKLFRQLEALRLGKYYAGCSEICTLFLRPKFRRANAGRLLSRVRFLFMAQHPQRFSDTVIAEMRGVSDAQGESPFWNWLRKHFIDLDFRTVTRMVSSGDNRPVTERMPRLPLYTHLMDEQARAVIGQVHEHTRPALAMLEAEGFHHTGYVDVFDAGPTVEAKLAEIRSVSDSRPCRIQVMEGSGPVPGRWGETDPGKVTIITNADTDHFRATVTSAARYLPAHNVLQVPATLAKSLSLGNHGQARVIELSTTGRHPQVPTVSLQQHQEAIHAHR